MSRLIGDAHKTDPNTSRNNSKSHIANVNQNVMPHSKYEEIQNEELEVLRSIYMEDYEDVESKRAWSRATERTFKIKLFAYSDKDVWVYLIATLTATYPATAPTIQLGETRNVRPQTVTALKQLISTRIKELIGEVMIHEIASSVQDELEHDASVKAKDDKVPSLEEERAVQEAAAAEQVREQEQEARIRNAQQKLLADQEVQRKLDEQAKKREETKLKANENAKSLDNLSAELPRVDFEQIISFKTDEAIEQQFRAVSLLSRIGEGKVTTVYTALPVVQAENPGTLVIKRASGKSPKARTCMLELEQILEKLKSLRHANIIGLLDFKIQNDLGTWNFDILTEYANRGSLRDLLSVVEHVPVQKARRLGLEVLQGLEFYHRNGINHGRIHCGNILLQISASGNVGVKLADSGFQSALYSMASLMESPSHSIANEPSWWSAPEASTSEFSETSKKSDIWAFGVALVEMIMGTAAIQKFPTAANFMNNVPLSEPFEDLLRALFRNDPRKRPNAFEVAPFEFLRVNVPALVPESDFNSSGGSFAGAISTSIPGGLRHESSTGVGLKMNPASRYAKEWDELGRLGRGGFGEVVKARNKLDGRIYAIKKIAQKTPAELSQVLSEVYLLATMNHPYVVRYYTAWPEDDAATSEDTSDYSTSRGDAPFPQDDSKFFSPAFGKSTGGLDFISSSGFPKIEFGYDDEDEDGDENENAVTDDESDDPLVHNKAETTSPDGKNLNIIRTRSSSRPTIKSTLYIQMEFCERLTLRDVIQKGLQDNIDEIWRLFRQILEGLAHIHSHGIIHRDLKPENVFIDSASNVRIGDFGLAKSGHFSTADHEGASKTTEGEMTQNVGTTFYVAPELQTNTKGTYTDKIDMYSLGIIFFEMCFPLKTSMERGDILTSMRKKDYTLPAHFLTFERAVQGEIIDSLLKHRPSERPSSAELLRSGKVPLQIEDETIKVAIEGLSDDGSPYYHRMMSALFSKNSGRQIRAQMWDMSGRDGSQTSNLNFVLLQSKVRERIVACFRRHGAVESQRQGLLPRADYYENKNLVQLLDSSGTLVQLPYDLTLPHARAIAKQGTNAEKTYAIGMVYRDSMNGGPPQNNREADFDIISQDDKDLALNEAEVIKVVDEMLDEFPPLASASMCFHVSHSKLLEHIMEFCRIPHAKRSVVKEILGRLNIQQWTWQKIRVELRSTSIGVSATSLDELARFDFRDTAEKSLVRLQSIFADTSSKRQLQETFNDISGLVEYCKRWGVRRPIYVCPFSSFNDKFYTGKIMFQCLFDGKRRDVMAAGGRYDWLIEDIRSHLPGNVSNLASHAVGVNIAWDRIVTSMVRYQKSFTSRAGLLKRPEDTKVRSGWNTRSCDVLVGCFDDSVLRSTGIRLVAWLWSHDISSELALDSRSTEDLLSHHREGRHSWIIIIKHEATASMKADLKIKSLEKKEDFDIRTSDLISFLRGEMRERDQKEGASERQHAQKYHGSANDPTPASRNARKSRVQILTAAHKSKKSNKFRAIEAAQMASHELLHSFGDGPVASVETSDDIMDMIRETRLSDTESWRRVVQKVSLNERNYIQEVQRLLQDFKTECVSEAGVGASFVFNFRTGKCIFYDLLA